MCLLRQRDLEILASAASQAVLSQYANSTGLVSTIQFTFPCQRFHCLCPRIFFTATLYSNTHGVPLDICSEIFCTLIISDLSFWSYYHHQTSREASSQSDQVKWTSRASTYSHVLSMELSVRSSANTLQPEYSAPQHRHCSPDPRSIRFPQFRFGRSKQERG